ncbi:GNAT family N-acetyltransferase [Rhodococcus erythropolis]|uniref:GNAT family N-acetyltransferase n=1 Tax=Rhodococcus erythropolis TaxID=1833 RepID=UPI00355AD08C
MHAASSDGRSYDSLSWALSRSVSRSPSKRVAVLELLAVSPHAVGRGWGTALLVDAVNSTQLAGYRKIELQVRAGNSRAIDLYRSIGFERTGRVDKHPLGGDAMVTFARALP